MFYNCHKLPWIRIQDMIVLCKSCGRRDYMIAHVDGRTLEDYAELDANFATHCFHRNLGCIADDTFVSRILVS